MRLRPVLFEFEFSEDLRLMTADRKKIRQTRGKIKSASIEELDVQYKQLAPLASRFAEQLCEQMSQLLEGEHISLSIPIQRRVKEWASIVEKLERRRLVLSRVTDLQDVVGVRLILQFA